jgi:mRNA interferase HigB
VTIVGADKLTRFGEKHERAQGPLRKWRNAVEVAEWKHSVYMKRTFRTANVVGSQTVFDIGGNKCRLVARVSYVSQIVLVQYVLTHAEYDKEDWKE